MIDFDVIVDEPFRATLLHSPGRKPWVRCLIHLLSPKGAALPRRKTNARVIVPLLDGARYYFGFVYTQDFISGFTLIAPWALQECRAYGTRN